MLQLCLSFSSMRRIRVFLFTMLLLFPGIGSTDDSIFKSDGPDDESWFPMLWKKTSFQGICEQTPNSLSYSVVGLDGNVWGAKGGYNLFTSDDKLNTIRLVYTFPAYIAGIHIMNNGVIIVSTDFDRWDNSKPCTVYRSRDGGSTFENILVINAGSAIWWSITSDSHNNLYVGEYGPQIVDSSKNVWKSSDFGDTWEVVFCAPNQDGVHIHVIRVDPYTDNLWIVHGDLRCNGIYMSSDQGKTWIDINHGNQPTSMEFTEDAVFFGEDGPEGRVSRYDKITGIYETVFTVSQVGNYGGSAYAMSKGLSGMLYVSFVKYAQYSFKPSIWASRGGYKWELVWEEDVKEDIFQGFVTLTIPDKDGFIFGSNLKIAENHVDVDESVIDTVVSFTLSGFPNPFNMGTTIAFTLPFYDESCSLDLFSVTGQHVRKLVQSPQNVGIHYVYWNGTDDRGLRCTSGVYLCRYSSHKVSTTIKLLLLR